MNMKVNIDIDIDMDVDTYVKKKLWCFKLFFKALAFLICVAVDGSLTIIHVAT